MDKLIRTTQECSAQVDEVQPRDGQILLLLSVLGAQAEKAVLLLVARGGGRAEMRLHADTLGRGRFQVRLPLDILATACTAREWIWDLYVDTGNGERPLRLGRQPGDLPGQGERLIPTGQRAAGVRLEPYFTVKGNLSFACGREQGR